MKLRKRNPLAVNIQFPKLSSKMTEAMCLYLIREKSLLPSLSKKELVTKGMGKNFADLNFKGEDGIIKVEVKATGDRELIRLTKGDLIADYVVWINFGSFFKEPTRNFIEIYYSNKINEFFSEPKEITLKNYKEALGKNLKKQEFNIREWIGNSI